MQILFDQKNESKLYFKRRVSDLCIFICIFVKIFDVDIILRACFQKKCYMLTRRYNKGHFEQYSTN